MPFSALLGNDLAQEILKRSIKHQTMPHVLLFAGPDGVGKGLFALKTAELLMGPPHAAKIISGNHPDLHVLQTEGKAGMHPIEHVRSLIKEAGMPPFEAPVKVFIIHDAHQMLPSSSNALLKTLEEPFPNTYFILLTSQAESILPTILSRSRKIPFFPLSHREIERFLIDQRKQEPHEAKRIAFLSHGSLSKAADLSERKPNTCLHRLMQLRLPQEYAQFLGLCDELEKQLSPSSEEESSVPLMDSFLEELCAWYRDLHLLKTGGAPEYVYHLEALPILQERAQQPLLPLEEIMSEILHIRLALQRHIKWRVALEQFFSAVSRER